MKFVILILFVLATWFLIDELVLRDRNSQGLDTFWDRLRDLGKRLHFVFGILAVLIIVIMILRFIIRTVRSP